MENASKALLISGGMLVAMLLLTLFSYLFSLMGEQTAGVYEQMEAADIREFNQKFLQYDVKYRNDKEKYITIQDVVTIVNLAIHSNLEQKYTDKINVYVYNCSCKDQVKGDWASIYMDKNKDKNGILEEHIEDVQNDKRFVCEVTVNSETAVVDKIDIRMID